MECEILGKFKLLKKKPVYERYAGFFYLRSFPFYVIGETGAAGSTDAAGST